MPKLKHDASTTARKVLIAVGWTVGLISGLPAVIAILIAIQSTLRGTAVPWWAVSIALLLSNLGTVTYIVSIRLGHELVRTRPSEKIADSAFYEAVTDRLLSKVREQTQGLTTGQLTYSAAEVRSVNVALFNAFAGHKGTICATSICSDPALWRSRGSYLAANEDFVIDGGSIQRAFICREGDLADPSFAGELLKVLDQQESIGIVTGIAIAGTFDRDACEDFILFDGAGVVWERSPIDHRFTEGETTLFLQRDEIERWRLRWDLIWNRNDSPSARQLAVEFRRVHTLKADGTATAAVDSVVKHLLSVGIRQNHIVDRGLDLGDESERA